jgi:hypothetical protein
VPLYLQSGLVTARIKRSTNQSIPVSGAYTDIAFDSAGYQFGGTFWTTGANITIPVPGMYSIVTQAKFDIAPLGGISGFLQVLVNGSLVIDIADLPTSTGNTTALRGIMQRIFAGGDTLKMQARHTGTSAINILNEGDFSPDIILTRES